MRSESKQLRLSWESHIIPYLGGEIIEKSMGMIIYVEADINGCLQNPQSNAFLNLKKKMLN